MDACSTREQDEREAQRNRQDVEELDTLRHRRFWKSHQDVPWYERSFQLSALAGRRVEVEESEVTEEAHGSVHKRAHVHSTAHDVIHLVKGWVGHRLVDLEYLPGETTFDIYNQPGRVIAEFQIVQATHV